MKKILPIVLSILLTASLILTGCTGKYDKGSSVIRWGGKIILNTDLPKFPDKLNYYSTVKPEVTIGWVEAIGDKLGINDEAEFTSSGNRFIMSEGDEWIEVDTDTGAITIRGIYIPNQTDANLTSSENAAVIATELLEYLGLWADNIELKEVGLRYEGAPIKEEWGVRFNQYIDGYPLVGGSKSLSVIVNMYGTVLSAGYFNPELEYAGEIDCITVQEAYDIFLAGEALGSIISPGFKKIVIDDVYTGYYIESQTELQEYVMPVYVFEGEYIGSGGDSEIFRVYVEATKS